MRHPGNVAANRNWNIELKMTIRDGTMQIRLATQDHVTALAELYVEFFAHNAEQQPRYYKKAFESGSYPASTIANEKEDIFVAVEDDMLHGFIHVVEGATPPYDCFVPQTFATIVDLYVRADRRRKGIGASLLDAARQWAHAKNLDYLELNVLAENEDGIRFYRHQRFNAVSQIMRLRL